MLATKYNNVVDGQSKSSQFCLGHRRLSVHIAQTPWMFTFWIHTPTCPLRGTNIQRLDDALRVCCRGLAYVEECCAGGRARCLKKKSRITLIPIRKHSAASIFLVPHYFLRFCLFYHSKQADSLLSNRDIYMHNGMILMMYREN